MERTISFMMNKGSIRHNIRAFKADNVDSTRTSENVIIKNIPIKQAYKDLFDDALVEYNAKQKRQDRKIDDYYEHIRTSKQYKLFHEIIVQVGNKDDCSATGEYANLMKEILCEYALDFERRNPNLYIICSVIHMDEQTPHLHIDYIPVSHNNKRGLRTQNSLKGAFKELGFVGETKGDTEWKKFAESEKEMLAVCLHTRGIEWEQKGTHEEHLSVLDYKKKERADEVIRLEQTKADLIAENKITRIKILEQLRAFEEKANEDRKILKDVRWKWDTIDEMDKWQPPEPEVIGAKKYLETQVKPFWNVVREGIKGFVQRIKDLKAQVKDLLNQIGILENKVKNLEEELKTTREDLNYAKDREEAMSDRIYQLDLLERVYGEEQIAKLVNEAKQEIAKIRVRRR